MAKGFMAVLLLGMVAAGAARAEALFPPKTSLSAPSPIQQVVGRVRSLEHQLESADDETGDSAQSEMSVDQALATVDRSGLADVGPDDTPTAAPLSYAPPPRTIDDITRILDRQKPDPAKRAVAQAEADKTPPNGAPPAELATFYFQRGIIARSIGRDAQYLDDEKKASALADQAQLDPREKNRYLGQVSQAYADTGDYRSALDLQDVRLRESLPNPARAIIFYLKFNYAIALGEIDVARDAFNNFPSRSKMPGPHVRVLRMRARLAAAEGRYTEAEGEIRSALAIVESTLLPQEQQQGDDDASDTKDAWRRMHDFLLTELTQSLLGQNRFLEAEAEIRAELLGCLEHYGRFSYETATAVQNMSLVLIAQARFAEAEKLALAGRDILTNIGEGPGSVAMAIALTRMAVAQAGQQKYVEARATYAELFRIAAGRPDLKRRYIDLNLNYIIVSLVTTRSPDAASALQALVEFERSRLGDNDYSTALARGWLGMVQLDNGDRAHAAEAFAAAIPVLLSNARSAQSQNMDTSAQREIQTRGIGEAYLSLLADTAGADAAAATFALGDALRARTVGQALAESAARAAASDPALANLARHEQDAAKQIGALQTMLADLLSQPTEGQDPDAAAKLKSRLAQLRSARAALKQAINRQFPLYADYIDPKPATIEQAQKSLRPGEAMVVFYVGASRLFTWAIPAHGAAVFAAPKVGYKELAGIVADLRRTLDPNANTLDQIPEFDVVQSYRLYQILLQPVEAGWSGAQTLIVVPHRVLGELPLSVLVTMPTKPISAGPIRFSAYQSVPFLARKLAVAQLPSVGALATLRGLPNTAGGHTAFVGFGDPWFSEAEAREAANDNKAVKTAGLQSRGVPIHRRSAPRSDAGIQLSQLPRLPDTAEEVRDIATALHADPQRDVFLGAAANEKTVRTMNLADRRIIVFATHGLVPEDLAGLTQPALALSAPDVAHVEGDGLLTVNKILGLRLNADWVVLSACNTAAGSGAGAEAVSGLGRAFFYAGARALLVSNWPVETVSARNLTTDLFRHVAANAKLARAEALRQAELALIDGPGAVDPASGHTVFSYAHPIFWAPFAVIGDGGAAIE